MVYFYKYLDITLKIQNFDLVFYKKQLNKISTFLLNTHY
jgi:hypothetical protein